MSRRWGNRDLGDEWKRPRAKRTATIERSGNMLVFTCDSWNSDPRTTLEALGFKEGDKVLVTVTLKERKF